MVLLLSACFSEHPSELAGDFVENPREDYDGDRLLDDEVCNDADPNVGFKQYHYRDSDGDGEGFNFNPQYACAAPAGTVSNNINFDDSRGDTDPGAAHVTSPTECLTDLDGDGISDCIFGTCDLAVNLAGRTLDFVLLSAGEEPSRRYTLTNDFYIMTTALTQ